MSELTPSGRKPALWEILLFYGINQETSDQQSALDAKRRLKLCAVQLNCSQRIKHVT
jgi:hypothetical protein